jgi:hypothetical protein
MQIDRETSENYDPFGYKVNREIKSTYTLSGVPGTTLQLYAGFYVAGEEATKWTVKSTTWAVKSGNDSATVDNNGLVTFTGTGEVIITSKLNAEKTGVTEYKGPDSVNGVEGSAGGISYVITGGEASVSWSYDADHKIYTVRVYSTVDATIAVSKPIEGYTIIITDGTNSTAITSASETTEVSIKANSKKPA